MMRYLTVGEGKYQRDIGEIVLTAKHPNFPQGIKVDINGKQNTTYVDVVLFRDLLNGELIAVFPIHVSEFQNKSTIHHNMCLNCFGKRQWYSPDNGQVVTCADCNPSPNQR